MTYNHIFNGHSDILSDINLKRLNGETDVFRKYHYPNFIKSGVNQTIFVIWTDPEHVDDPYARVSQIIDSMKKELVNSSDLIHIVRNYSDLAAGKKEEKINALIGMEGLSHIGENIDLIDAYYNDIGLRHISLTWNEKNPFASGVSDSQGGLTNLGKKAVERIEKLGILLDVSHVNEPSFWDIVDVAKGPIIASHSNCKALADVPRNLTDEQIIAIGKSGGLIGINACSLFVGTNGKVQTMDDLIKHIDHIKNLIGIEHLAFGFDFCDFLPTAYVGLPDERTKSITVQGLASEADIMSFMKRMLERGYTEDEVNAIAYNNYDALLKKILK